MKKTTDYRDFVYSLWYDTPIKEKGLCYEEVGFERL